MTGEVKLFCDIGANRGDFMKYEEIKTKYDTLSVGDIEDRAHSNQAAAAIEYREFILTLYYLERTSRYRENKRYEHEPFERYLREQYNFQIGSYENARSAFIRYPEASEALGVGRVIQIERAVGKECAPEVMKEIKPILLNDTIPEPERIKHVDSVVEKKIEEKKELARKINANIKINQVEKCPNCERVTVALKKEKKEKERYKEMVDRNKIAYARDQGTIEMLKAKVEQIPQIEADRDYWKSKYEEMVNYLSMSPFFQRVTAKNEHESRILG